MARYGAITFWLIAGMLAVSPAWAVDPAVIEAQNRRVEVIRKVAPSVVAIFPPGGGGGGSGVLISPDGYALTNFHVTSGAGNFMKCGLNDGKLYDAVIVGIDPTGDVALIKLLGRDDFPFAPMGDSDRVKVGDWAYAMGNPFLLATDFQPTVTYGIVSGVHRYQYPAGTFLEYTDCIQIDTSINPGNSGGPLFNEDGEIIGINGRGSFEKRGRVNSGAGYAISINQIKNFMGHLKSGRIVDHATLGLTVTTDPEGLVVVDSILEQSEAFRRGLREGDEVIAFAGRPVRSVNQFKNVLGIYPKGWKLPLVFRHESETYEVLVRLRGLHRKSELTPQRPRPRRQPRPRRRPEDEKKPGEDKPDDQQPDGEKPDGDKPDEKKPGPLPFGHRPEPPEKYKHMFIKKEGYANYYFNKLAQERLLNALERLGHFSDVDGVWILAGKAQNGLDFEFTLADEGVGLTYGDRAFLQPLGAADPVDEPPGTGGLLVAMHHLRLLLTTRGQEFTDFYYLGTEPLDGGRRMVDVLVGVLTGVESRWYFDPEDGSLLGLDTRLTPNDDECEIRFEQFGEFEGRRLPRVLAVRHAGRDYAEFEVRSVQLSPAAEGEE